MSEQTITPTRPPRDNLYREVDLPSVVEFRAAEEGQDDLGPEYLGLLRGHFLVFNEWTEINSIFEGNFMERFLPRSTVKTIRENRDRMRPLFQHGRDPQVGDKPLGPIRELREDDTGTYYEVPLLDTTYNRDLLPGLKEGLYGASHRFRVMREEITDEPKPSEHNPRGLPERSIKEAQILEFGPVTFPAYEGATAGVRSITDEIIFGDFARDRDRLRQLVDVIAHRDRAADEPSETSPTDQTTDHPVEDAAPREERAGQPPTRASGRRNSRPLYGDPERRQAWRL